MPFAQLRSDARENLGYPERKAEDYAESAEGKAQVGGAQPWRAGPALSPSHAGLCVGVRL